MSEEISAMLEIRGLTKAFRSKEVLKGVDLTVPTGSVFGFVGKNGAGKTTTMKAVLGLLRPDKGEILVAGEPVTFGETKTNRSVGYLPDVPEFYGFLSPIEYLTLSGESLGLEKKELRARCEELLVRVGLEKENRRIGGFSRGMKQRLGIAQALLSRPKLLICDEPTSALDPIGRKEILDLLASVRNETTVLFSTHILSDVERICTDVAFLEGGKIVLSGDLETLKTHRHAEEFLLETATADAIPILTAAFPTARRGEGNILRFAGGEELMHEVLSFVTANRVRIDRLQRLEPSLESIFLEVAK